MKQEKKLMRRPLLHEEISQYIKEAILTGELNPHDMLPSMRLLAKELRISVITTKRAYEDLEKDGFIYTVVGKGSFVADTNRELLREEHLKRVEEYLEMAVKEAWQAGISKEEVREMLELLFEEA